MARNRLAALALLALVASSCGSTASTVATVNGEPIDASEVLALRDSFADGVNYSGEAFRQDLTPLVYLEAELQYAEAEFGLSGLDSDARANEKLANPTPDELDLITSIADDPDRTDATLRVVATQLVVREEVSGQLLAADEGFLVDLYENQPQAVAEVCARHIVTMTEQEAEDAKARIEAGEDFGEVANEVSLDTSSVDGVLPCPVPASALVEPFGSTAATAALGTLTGPIATQFGWHLLIVDERTAPASADELIADPVAFVDADTVAARWSIWLDEAVAAADIEIASQVGRWFPEADGILPPP